MPWTSRAHPPLKREDLLAWRRRCVRIVLPLLVICMIGTHAVATKIDELAPSEWGFPVILATGIGLPLWFFFSRVPRCPHCGGRFLGHLLPIAIATGKCGRCGESVED